MNDNTIYVNVKENSRAVLTFPKYNIETDALIGKNGACEVKEEGNKKTPLGTFDLGIALGTHPQEEMQSKMKIKYMQINENMYWVDDSDSRYYNQLVDTSETEKSWNSAEHLVDFPVNYELLIEIKANPGNTPNRGSAIFLHCTDGHPTLGCVGIDKNVLKKLMQLVDENTKIVINKNRSIGSGFKLTDFF